jgi:uncharacterized protein involved in type VI secretion and phage assembly
VTAVEHVYGRNETYVTRFTVGGLEPTGLVDLVGSPASHSALDVMPSGVTIGIVTNTKDEAAKHGHVKVKLPYLGTDGQGSDIESTWARLATIGAGNQRGVMFMPEVNDEVLVAFEHGDTRSPFVVGSLWNGVDSPPLGDGLIDGSTGAVRRRGFVSRLGHRMVFLDDDAKSGIALLVADDSLKLSLNASDTTIKVSSDGSVEISGSRSVQITSDGSISIHAGQSLELKGDAGVKIDGGPQVDIDGSVIQLN